MRLSLSSICVPLPSFYAFALPFHSARLLFPLLLLRPSLRFSGSPPFPSSSASPLIFPYLSLLLSSYGSLPSSLFLHPIFPFPSSLIPSPKGIFPSLCLLPSIFPFPPLPLILYPFLSPSLSPVSSPPLLSTPYFLPSFLLSSFPSTFPTLPFPQFYHSRMLLRLPSPTSSSPFLILYPAVLSLVICCLQGRVCTVVAYTRVS